MIHRLLFALLVAVSTGASAQELRHLPPTPRDFAWQWPLAVEPGEDLVRFTLTPAVYARLWREDTADLTVFNAADESVPVASLDSVLARATTTGTAPAPIDVPLFRTPAVGTRDAGDRLRLIVSQRTDGRLERLDADVEAASAAPSPELLLDLSAIRVPVRGLVVEFGDDAAPLVARVDVFGSHDLSSWTRLAAAQALVSLNEGGLMLERRRIELADTALPYLRLVRTDAREGLPVARVQALRSRAVDNADAHFAQEELVGHAEAARGLGFVYRSDGPFPVERLGVTLAERNAAASVIIESRARADLPWRERARGAVFRVAGKDGGIESAPLEIPLVRDREWRVRTEPPQIRPPTLTLGYRPDQFAFLTQGEGPFRLAAGSARSQRGSFPLHAVLVELRNTRGDTWLPPEARLGRGTELAGGAALAPRPDASGSPTPWQWLLWGLLLAGAFTVVTMVLKLLRQSGA